MALPLAVEVLAREGIALTGECLYAESLGSLEFSQAEVTLLVRAA